MSAEVKGPWVSVTKRMPEDTPGAVRELGWNLAVTDKVLCYGRYMDSGEHSLRLCRRLCSSTGRWMWEDCGLLDVSHWMPLPPVPEDEDEDEDE